MLENANHGVDGQGRSAGAGTPHADPPATTTPSATARSLPLTLLGAGKRGKVVRIEGGCHMTRHLAAIGIYTGTELTLVRGGHGGPVIVETVGSRFVLGRGMAHRITVQPAG